MESILAGSLIPDEIVISDQSNGDATRSVVEEVRKSFAGSMIRYVRSSRPGSSANRNDAFRATTGCFVAFVDDDMIVDVHWLERIQREWEDVWSRGPVLISGRILSGIEDSSFDPGARLSSVRTVLRKAVRTGDILYGGSFGASRYLFECFGPGPFDERLGVGAPFRGGEDEDLGYRALLAGFPVVYEPSIIVTHYPDMSNWRRSSYNRSFGGGAFFAKHIFQGDRSLLRNFVWVLFIQVAKSIRSYIGFRSREGMIRLLSFVGLLTGFMIWVFTVNTMQIFYDSDAGRIRRDAT